MRETADLILLSGAEDETGPDDGQGPDPVKSANVAPTDRVRVLLSPDGKRLLRRNVWGLIPPWSKTAQGAARMINARVETVADKPAFRRAVRTSRCLLPADAWYEWQVGELGRVPHLVRRADGQPLWLAGVWARWHPPDGGPVVASASVLTGPAPAELSWLHERAPLVVPEPFMDEWLSSDGGEPGGVLDTLCSVGYPPLEWYRVGRGVGQVRDKGAHLMLPATEPAVTVAIEEPGVLF
jgi:putative SOS response-associated peptidase YedK